MVIEYLAKPQLEARKDRIVEGNRERRKLMAKLFALTNEASRIAMLAQTGIGFHLGKAALESTRDDISELYPSLLKFEYLLTKRQRKLASKYVLGSPGKVQVLTVLAEMYESSGLHKMETMKEPRPEKLGMGPRIEQLWSALIEEFVSTYTVLTLSPYRPWSYFRTLRKLEQRHNEVERDLANSDDCPDEPRSEAENASSPDAP